MEPATFIYNYTLNHLERLGYNELQCTTIADHVLYLYRTNQLLKPTAFIDVATTFAKSQYGKPKKKVKAQ